MGNFASHSESGFKGMGKTRGLEWIRLFTFTLHTSQHTKKKKVEKAKFKQHSFFCSFMLRFATTRYVLRNYVRCQCTFIVIKVAIYVSLPTLCRSTEEYPHLRPARLRRGFIHRGIMVFVYCFFLFLFFVFVFFFFCFLFCFYTVTLE